MASPPTWSKLSTTYLAVHCSRYWLTLGHQPGSCCHGAPFCRCIRKTVGSPILSTSGFPKGCPLSPAAMLVVNLLYVRYMSEFCPAIRSMSYADNLTGHGDSAFAVVQSLQATEVFCEALGLELDSAKTYTCSTCSAQRTLLKATGHVVVESARELGGIFSFCAAVRNQSLQRRFQGLAPVWARLSRSKAPICLKLGAIPGKFWAKAMHGIEGCPIADSHINKLRATATRALRLCPSGASPMLRLSTDRNLELDPGFYQLWAVLTLFRRLGRKQPDFFLRWTSYMLSFDGHLRHGPFAKVLHVTNQVGWRITRPPFFVDRHGFEHDLQAIPTSALRLLAEGAWLWHVSRCHVHRGTMHELAGIDLDVLRADHHLPAPTLARQAALRSGAHMFTAAHARFDSSLSGLCEVCRVPDTPEHRVCHCPRYQTARSRFPWLSGRW